jgi:hypothetical protein
MSTEAFAISVEAYEIVTHILTPGYAAMGAALLFFVLTKNHSMPKYQMSSVVSVVVMVSALLLLYVRT